MKVYIDMDGVLAEWLVGGQYTNSGYYRGLKPNRVLCNVIRDLQNRGVDVYILSCYISPEAWNDKQWWLDQYLPEVDHTHRVFVPWGDRKTDYIHPVEPTDVLYDDYNPNLHDWEAAGGTAIKCLNGVNSAGSWRGAKIWHEAEPHLIADAILSAAGSSRKEN